MPLTIYNTLAREKEPFTPADPGNVRMYVCGPTVYDRAHIGNARPVVVFDVLFRLLRHLYGPDHVTYVRNITDVDDKIIAAAKEEGAEISAITTRYAEQYHRDMSVLGALPPTFEPRATDHIAEMIAMIEKLMVAGNAYEADGHVLFGVSTMDGYGALSRRNRDELIAGSRVEVAPYKQDAADFVMWKPSDDDQPGWDSPWGHGRPGWHLECSAMSEKLLGTTFDIHGGGQDLIFPHHENEIAQSVCAHDGAPFVRYWMHNGYVTVDGEKMSKSAGNFTTVHDLLEGGARGEAIRFALLSAHYRQPLDFGKAGIEEATKILSRWYRVMEDNSELGGPDHDGNEPDISGVLAALEDDLNTPRAIAALHQYDSEGAADQLVAGARFMGLLECLPEEWFRGAGGAAGDDNALSDAGIEDRIAARIQARKDKDFATADRIRDELVDQGIILEDSADGTIWRRR